MINSEVVVLPPHPKAKKSSKTLPPSGGFDAILRGGASEEVEGQGEASLLKTLFASEDSVSLFKEKVFQKNPAVCSNASISALEKAMLGLDVKALLAQTSSEQIHVWLPRRDKASLDSITVDDAEQAYKLFMAGHSLYCRAPAQVEEALVAKALEEMRFGAVGSTDRFRRGEVETFFSRAGHVTEFHADFQENFTIQLAGSKEWIFRDSTATHPLRGCTPHFNDEKERDVVEQQLKVLRLGDENFSASQVQGGSSSSVVLRPGDVLYHPAGLWHKVVCLEDSISINISLTGASYAEVLCSSLQQVLMENHAWRAVVSSEPRQALQVMQSLLTSLPNIVQKLTSSDVLPYPALIHGDSNVRDEDANDEDDDAEEEEEEVVDEDDGEQAEGSEVEEEEDEFEEVEEEAIVSVEEFSDEDFEALVRQASSPSSLTSQQDEERKEEGRQDKGKKRKASNKVSPPSKKPRGDEIHFFLNPLAMILSGEELESAVEEKEEEEEEEGKLYVIHCGYGNETLESLTRATLLVPAELVWAWQHVISLTTTFRAARREAYQNASGCWSRHFFTLRDLLEVGRTQGIAGVEVEEGLKKLVVAAHRVGVVSVDSN
eukprot:gene7203-7969_t